MASKVREDLADDWAETGVFELEDEPVLPEELEEEQEPSPSEGFTEDSVRLYLRETLTFLMLTSEASVSLTQAE